MGLQRATPALPPRRSSAGWRLPAVLAASRPRVHPPSTSGAGVHQRRSGEGGDRWPARAGLWTATRRPCVAAAAGGGASNAPAFLEFDLRHFLRPGVSSSLLVMPGQETAAGARDPPEMEIYLPTGCPRNSHGLVTEHGHAVASAAYNDSQPIRRCVTSNWMPPVSTFPSMLNRIVVGIHM